MPPKTAAAAGPDVKALAAVAVGALALVLAIAGVAAPQMYVAKVGDFSVGLFETKIGSTTKSIKCGDLEGCKKDQCGASQAFALLGIFANIGGLAVISAVTFMGKALPAVAGAGAYGFAAFSYMIVWALAAASNNRKSSDSCGGSSGTSDLGASFGLLIVAWLLCIGAAAATFMSGKAA